MLSGTEKTLREKLGIPADAGTVLFFSESSHWDPNWLFTSTEYYRLRINTLLDEAVRECEAEPGRIFGIECIFFLRMYWDKRPDRRDSVRTLVNEGRFRLTGSGVTTPDTCVPVTEAVIRDYLLGQEWLRENGMSQEPRLAYLPDNFGVVPTLPAILRALGYTQTALSRIDGCFYPGTDYANPRWFPRPGSSGELLERDLKANDFIWRGPDGSQVICHWNPFTYGQGDTLLASAPLRMMGVTFGLRSRSPRKVAQRIRGYVDQLAPLARTPYMLCPIGFDFNGPLPGLVSILDRYNREVYPHSGIYALNAGMDDYLDMVACRTESLPELAIDFNPYWTGFYSARPDVKHRCRTLVDTLLAVEGALTLHGDDDASTTLLNELAPAWETAVVANHHDFITGTSPDRVWKKEQRPWLVTAQATVDRVKDRAAAICRPPAPRKPLGRPPAFEASAGKVTIGTAHYRIVLSERSGGCIESWQDPETGEELLAGLAGDVVLYDDSGGLWRMGHEFAGGRFLKAQSASERPARLRTETVGDCLHAISESTLGKRRITRHWWFSDDTSFVRMRTVGSAGRWKTVTCRFSSRLRPEEIFMDVAGGVVQRPLVKIYNPTYWAASRFAHIVDASTGRGLALFMGGPASVSATENGVLECIALRNAPMERAWRAVPIPTAFPAYGLDAGEHAFDCAVGFTRAGDWRENRLHQAARTVLNDPFTDTGTDGLSRAVDDAVQLDTPDAAVLAVKRAHRGAGLIVRLQSFGARRVDLTLTGRRIASAFLTDARERDIRKLSVRSETVRVPLEHDIVTVRLLCEGSRP
jgi:hypothetical protein